MAAIDIFQISGDFTYVDNLTLDESVQVTKDPLNIISAKKFKKKKKQQSEWNTKLTDYLLSNFKAWIYL